MSATGGGELLMHDDPRCLHSSPQTRARRRVKTSVTGRGVGEIMLETSVCVRGKVSLLSRPPPIKQIKDFPISD